MDAREQMNIGFVVLTAIVILIAMIRYSLLRRRGEDLRRLSRKIEKDISDFLASFDPSSFSDFSALDFRIGRFSLVSPFPNNDAGELRYTIYLDKSEVEDVITILHEIVECTIGRVIERLLDLEKPLYIKRKQEDRFWILGKKQKYVIEHVMTTLCEAVDLDDESLKGRLTREDFKAWLDT